MIDYESPLHTDLYQLSMLDAYVAEGMAGEAVFELFVRRLPSHRNFLVAAGIESLLDWLVGLHFQADELAFLREREHFDERLLAWLANFRFQGDVHALPEGSVFFADEPIVQVRASIAQAQLIETRVVNLMQMQTVQASKAARFMLAAGGKALVDFGLRRAHGVEAGLYAARSAYLAGFVGSSDVAAGKAFGIPLRGTMAHSYILAHEREADAFAAFARTRPRGLTLLIDTYDNRAAARHVVELADALKLQGIEIASVRIDSGDLPEESRAVRAILDQGGLARVGIFASGGLDEASIDALVRAAAPIDGFGVGTALATSDDAPSLDCAYKLVEYAGQPKRKRSLGKANWPGAKQVYRQSAADGTFIGDRIALLDESPAGEPLLQPMLRQGQRLWPRESLAAARERCAAQLAGLPPSLRGLGTPGQRYSVEPSAALQRLAQSLDLVPH